MIIHLLNLILVGFTIKYSSKTSHRTRLTEMNQYDNGNQMYTSNLNNKSTVGNYLKIDSENFVDQYRALKQQQKDFLLKINMSAKLKREIFGFTDLKQHRKPDENQKLVTLIDPFKGRLIMKQKVWLEISKQRQEERNRLEKEVQRRQQQEMERAKQLQEQKEKQIMKQKESQSIDENSQHKQNQKKTNNFFTSILKKFSKQKDIKQLQKQKSRQKLKQKSAKQQQPLEKPLNLKNKKRNLSPNNNNQLAKNQYNIKIQGHSRITPTPVVQRMTKKLEPSKKDDAAMNILGAFLQNKPKSDKSPKNEQRMRTTMKFMSKQEDQYSNISEIQKLGSPKDFTSSQSSVKSSGVSSMGDMLQSNHRLRSNPQIKR